MTASYAPAAPDAARKDKILATLKTIINDLTGIDPGVMDVHADFLELGIESLLIIQATQVIQDKFAIKLSVIQLLEELTTLNAVAGYLDQCLPPEEVGAIQADPVAAARAELSAEVASVSSPLPQQDAPANAFATAAPQLAAAAPAEAKQQVAAAPQTAYPPRQPQNFNAAAGPVHTQEHGAGNGGPVPAVPASVLEQIMAQQLQVMAQQLEMLGGSRTGPEPHASAPARQMVQPEQLPPATAQPASQAIAPAAQPMATTAPAASVPTTNEHAAETRAQIQPETFVPYQPIQKGATGGLTPRQQQHLDDLIQRYTNRTRESKRLTQLYRPYVADSRVSAGFRLLWKEMIYQIVGQRSQGSKIWDVDGNEYVDITMGFGLHLFGHSPSFITAALQAQLALGMELGPQSPLVGKVAKLISELTGLDRVNFCNSGTEAVMGALRIARTVTRRNKIALFAGAYHGWSDATLARKVAADGTQPAVPMAPGVPPRAVEDTLVLEWNDPRSLDILRAQAHELACVLVEPVQSRRPDIQPKEYLHELRRITEQSGSLLIIDEMVTGFRVHPGGAQAWFDVQADLAIYGKVVGGGLPLGIVAGKAAYMDVFDGGMWNYGDASYPRAEKTLFVGAYFKHPLTMAVAHAILSRLKTEGHELLGELNERTTRLTQVLDNFFAEQQLPVRVANYGSLFRLLFSREFKYVDLFYYHLQENGVFIWEGRNCFLSTAHTDEDVAHIIRAVQQSIAQMRAGGFLPDAPPDKPGGGRRAAEATPEHTTATARNGESAPPAPAQSLQAELGRTPELPAETQTGTTAQAAPPQASEPATSAERAAQPARPASGTLNQQIQFSLYYFGNYPTEFYPNKYDLVFQGAKFADEHNFTAVWLPERHFNSYGGFSPNPAIVAAALARETKRIQLRAGSVALPLHHPIRVAEEWAIIDNLSRGRVAISFASGWHANDFVFAPEAYENRRQVMDEGIELVRQLWRGAAIQVRDGKGEQISVRLSPMPMQAELPFWLTGATMGTAIKAGQLGAGYLTNLQDQTIDELAEKIAAYRAALNEHGHAPETARVTVLLHTFMTDDVERSLQQARAPFQQYLRASMGLQVKQARKQGPRVDFGRIAEADLDYLTAASFERYLRVGTLIGTPDSCTTIVDKLIKSGVTEVGCFVDFGLPTDEALASLHYVNQLRARYQTWPANDARTEAQPNGHHELLTLRTHAADSEPPRAVAAPRAVPELSRVYAIPLTDTQKQFWALIQRGEHISSAYNESAALHLRGPFDLAAMRAALQTILDRHDALRSTFSATGDYQQIHAAMQLDVPLVSFAHLSDESERVAQSEAWARAEMQKPFDLARGPLLRAQLAKLAEQQHLLLITTHHIIADGQSWGVLLKELSLLYSANCQQLAAQLPPPVPLGAQGQQPVSGPQDEDIARAESYWLKQFADGFPSVELPADYPRPPMPTYQRAQCFRQLDAALGKQLKTFSKQHGCTLFVTLLTGYKLLLYQLTAQSDLVVGINAADPASVGRQAAIGYRLHPLAVRCKISGDPPVKELLAAEKRLILEAYDNQHFSLDKLFKQLHLRRDPRRSSLVAAGFNLDHSSPTMAGFHELAVEISAYSTSAPSLDVYLDITEIRDELRLKCNYNTDLFAAQTVARWLAHLESLLQAMVAQPEQRLSLLPQLPVPQPTTDAHKHAETHLAGQVAQRSNLTKYQLLFWAGQKLNPEAVIFVNVGVFHLAQQINPRQFQRAFQTLVDHSDALRTVIDEVDGVPQRRVVEKFSYQLEYLDFSQAAAPRAQLAAWAQARCRQPFDMSTRLFDAALVKLGPAEFAWYVNVHHVIADAASLALVGQFGLNYYQAVLEKRLKQQPRLPLFADFIAAEQELLTSPKYREAESYWQEKLAAPLEPLAFYGKAPVKQTTNVERIVRKLGRTRTQKIKALATHQDLFIFSEDATLFNIFAALCVQFLCSITGSRRIAFGVPFHNRRTKAFQETIGLFMRILPLRVEVAEDETFLTLMKKINREFYTALRYHEYAVGNPLQQQAYEVEFNYINHVVTSPDGSPVELEWLHPGHANESLAVQIHDIDQTGDLTLNFDFHCDVFSAADRAQALEHFLQVVDAFIADYTQPLQTVSVLTPADRQKLLVEFNQTTTSFPLDQTFTQLFEAQVARTPDAAAVAFAAQTLTYAELNARANRVARQLRAAGVGPGSVVPLLARRSADFLTGLLAILKAGGAYLPLDPFYPPQRLSQLLDQSQSARVLVASEFQSALAPWLAAAATQPAVFELEELLQSDSRAANLPTAAAPGDLSYVIYTSGSTGVPKGVMIEQRGMVNHLYAKINELKLTAADVVAQTASQAFDISVWQFLAPLLVGGRVLIVNDEVARDATQLLTLVESQGATVLETVPSLLRALLAELASTGTARPRLSALRWLLVTGEALPPDLCAAWLGSYADIPLLNAYGPTECSDDVTHYVVARKPVPATSIPIGRPIANMRTYVLERTLAPLPLGLPGELYVGGVGVGRGYLNDPARTAEVFVPDPFSGPPGARLYKTGDLVRYGPAGNLEFLGRIDQQVKIRGYRIELGEIAVVLRQHPGVQEAVVTAREETPGDKRLVAYLVARPGQSVTLNELRSYLQERLPDYMLPAVFVTLAALPLMPNGKVDSKALPVPDLTRPALQVAFVAPRTPAEEALARIFKQVLHLEQVGVHDNFFELGGDSILSIQIVSRANQAGFRLTPMLVFQHQTIAELAAVANVAQAVAAEQGLVTGRIPLTPIQHWFFQQQLPNPQHYNQALLLEVQPPLRVDLIEQTVAHLLQHHDALRLRFKQQDAQWEQYALGVEESAALVRFDLSTIARAEQRAALEAAAARLQASLALSEGPLMRAACFDLGAGQPGRLLLVIHHLAVDGVSWRVLLEDFQIAYRQLSRGEQIELPLKTTSYKEWAERLTEYAQTAEVRRECAYWLAPARAHVRPLPVDEPQGENSLVSVRRVSRLLTPDETQALLKEVPGLLRVQINDLLLTALAQAFAGWSGASSLLLNLESHGREEVLSGVDLTRTVGWFTTIAPLLLELNMHDTPVQQLAAVKEQLQLVPHRGIGYGLLRYLCADEQVRAQLAELPQAEVSFNYLGQLDQMLPEAATLKLATEATGPTNSGQGRRLSVFDINGLIVEGQLRFDWSYSENLHRRETVEALAQSFMDALRAFIASGQTPAPVLPAAAFTDFNWTQTDIAEIAAVLDKLE